MPKAKNIEAILLDKDGVFVDFHKLWLRVIAYRAQLIAEYTTDCWDQFNQVRTACIRAMGVDEDEELLDPYAPCSLPEQEVKVALKTATHLTVYSWDPTFSWKKSSDIVERVFSEANSQLDFKELTEAIDGSIDKIKEIASKSYKLAVFSSDSADNVKAALEKFEIEDLFTEIQAGELKNTELYKACCKRMGLEPEQTLLVSDSPTDLLAASEAGAYSIGVLTGVVPAGEIGTLKVCADEVISSLKDLDLSSISGPSLTA